MQVGQNDRYLPCCDGNLNLRPAILCGRWPPGRHDDDDDDERGWVGGWASPAIGCPVCAPPDPQQQQEETTRPLPSSTMYRRWLPGRAARPALCESSPRPRSERYECWFCLLLRVRNLRLTFSSDDGSRRLFMDVAQAPSAALAFCCDEDDPTETGTRSIPTPGAAQVRGARAGRADIPFLLRRIRSVGVSDAMSDQEVQWGRRQP